MSPQNLRVGQRMRAVPRRSFVPPDLVAHANENRPLPIGYGQTISQPFIVAYMTEALAVQAEHRVLEIGTGCGYQTAILAGLVERVFTIERIPELAARAEITLEKLGIENAVFRTGDGYAGWPEEAPFDRILVTAAPREVPQPLLAQLTVGGRLVAPVGLPHDQRLVQIDRRNAETWDKHELIPVRFVPLVSNTAISR